MNPHGTRSRQILSLLRMPISPLRRGGQLLERSTSPMNESTAPPSTVSDSFKMLVPVYFETPDRKTARIGVMNITGNSSSPGEVQLPFRPRRVFLNAFEEVLATIDE